MEWPCAACVLSHCMPICILLCVLVVVSFVIWSIAATNKKVCRRCSSHFTAGCLRPLPHCMTTQPPILCHSLAGCVCVCVPFIHCAIVHHCLSVSLSLSFGGTSSSCAYTVNSILNVRREAKIKWKICILHLDSTHEANTTTKVITLLPHYFHSTYISVVIVTMSQSICIPSFSLPLDSDSYFLLPG